MFIVFRRTQSANAEPQNTLMQFAFAPIVVGLIATILGVFVGIEKSKFGAGAFWTTMTLSVSILLCGVAILLRSWFTKQVDTPSENPDSTE